MKEKLRKLMAGRYGVDELTLDALRVSIGVFVLSIFVKHIVVVGLGTALMAYGYYRAFSKDFTKRQEERTKYLTFRAKLFKPFQKTKKRIADGKTYRFYRCENCKTELRVPKGKGKVKITCPNCHHVFEKRV